MLRTCTLRVNYRRVLELEDQLVGSVFMHFEKKGIVCPPNLWKGIFTVGALDNLQPPKTHSMELQLVCFSSFWY